MKTTDSLNPYAGMEGQEATDIRQTAPRDIAAYGETPTKLNIGAGKESSGGWLSGYINIDRSRVHSAKGYKEAYPLTDWETESCEEVRASHVLEHFPMREIGLVLQEWVRVLKPGGWLKVAVPDFQYIATEYLRDELDIPIAGYCMGGQTDENDFHKAIFDREGLEEAFADIGLINIQPWVSELKDCASLPVSLNLMGQKPELQKAYDWAEGQKPKDIPRGEVIAVMSIPRLSFTDNAFAVLQGVAGLGLRVLKSSGVFWGQCLTELIEQATEGGAKYVLTIDYDTLFKPDDVKRLYTLMEANPHADATMPLQMKRDSDSPLFTRSKTLFQEELRIAREDFDVDLYPAMTGHFGLTLLRTEAFEKLPKPWFRSEPGSDGRWSEGHKDEDIAFWHNWQESGNTLFLVPRVTIGHLQLLATWPDTELRARHQYLSEFHKEGKPDWAWR